MWMVENGDLGIVLEGMFRETTRSVEIKYYTEWNDLHVREERIYCTTFTKH